MTERTRHRRRGAGQCGSPPLRRGAFLLATNLKEQKEQNEGTSSGVFFAGLLGRFTFFEQVQN
ncbi:hypothetical protein M885DRAFT_60903 [Pelagophyceae sp. CCMP2097]|nr:hypothetical protein M885DRAFT_60903 [Pelagophyceae sp. CCMP2097]